jgi:DHA1 family multidrug resistance protein-like MFS transporter
MQLAPLEAVTGFAMGGVLAAMAVLLMELSPKGQEGMVYGVSGTAMSIGNAIGPIVGSAMGAWWGLRTPFLAAGATFLVSAFVAVRYLPRSQPAREPAGAAEV